MTLPFQILVCRSVKYCTNPKGFSWESCQKSLILTDEGKTTDENKKKFVGSDNGCPSSAPVCELGHLPPGKGFER